MSNYRDGTLEQGQAMQAVNKTVLLTADNQGVSVDIETLILIGSDNTTATSRTFTLTPSTVGVGHQLRLIWNTAGSTKGQLVDTGTAKLNGDWLPGAVGDSLTLVSDGTNWVEVSRGYNGTTSTIALTDGHILVGNSTGVAADVAMSGDVTISDTGATAIGANKVVTAMINADAVINSKLADGCVSIEQLDSGIAPAYFVYAAGTVAMSGTSQDITVASATSSDIGFVQINTADSNNRTVLTAITATGKVTVTYSGAAGTGGNISYQVLRVAS